MSEMVERVARALHSCVMQNDLDQPPWEALGRPWREECLFMARAAMAAMMEPTNVMLKASCAAMSEGKRPTPDRVSSKEKHRIRYRAMIAAELNRQTFSEAVAVTNGVRDGG